MPAASDSKAEKMNVAEKINDFIQKNRSKLLASLVAAIIIMLGIVVFITVRNRLISAALAKVDAFNSRYEELKVYISGDDPDSALKQADVDTLLDDITAFASKNSGFAAARAYAISAGIYWERKDWAEAEKAFTASAEKGAKTYLAPASLYNAAAAAEESGSIEAALDLYKRSIDFGTNFPAAARAQFSIGRLEESRNNRDAALAAYNTLVSRWPNDPVWANLAQSRIIVLLE